LSSIFEVVEIDIREYSRSNKVLLAK